jgi:hypothetical protein
VALWVRLANLLYQILHITLLRLNHNGLGVKFVHENAAL